MQAIQSSIGTVLLLFLVVSCSGEFGFDGESGDGFDNFSGDAEAADGGGNSSAGKENGDGSGAGGDGDDYGGESIAGGVFPGGPADGSAPAFKDGVTECYFPSPGTPAPSIPISGPIATIERTLEKLDNTDVMRIRLTFNPQFVDNSYGVNAVGWAASKKGQHTFKMLAGSDHAVLLFKDAAGSPLLQTKLDYISEALGTISNFGNLGVDGGDGALLLGSRPDIMKTMTSLDRNLNERGYGSYLENSPATDGKYTPNPAAPNWDFRVVYELWVKKSALGAGGMALPTIESVHASPSKLGSNTVEVTPMPCP